MALDPLPTRPLVSILISNYNYAAFLEDAIESCLRQTYEGLEIVVCDDGSTDASSIILARLQSRDERIKVIYQRNGGQALALNAAFQNSTGDIICLLDADDVFMPEKVEKVVCAFALAPHSGFVVNRMLRVDKARRNLGDVPLLSPLASGWIRPFLSLTAPHVAPGLPPCSGLSLRRPVAEAIFPLATRLTAYADTLIQVLAPLITSIVALDTPLSEYRVHGVNVAAVREFTEHVLQKRVAYEREVWEAWREFLASPHSGLPPDFPIPSKMPSSPMSYAYARFQQRSATASGQRVIGSEYFQTWPSFLRWYWRATSLMPDWLFKKSFNLLYGQTRSKMFVGRLLGAYRMSKVRCLRAANAPNR